MTMTRKELADQTKATILDVARQLFLNQGYQATSTRAIAEQCGITQPNLYHHFKNKKVLFKCVVEEIIKDIEKVQIELLAEKCSPEEKLVSMMTALMTIHPANFFSMLEDFKEIMSEENQKEFFEMYQTAYLAPFISVFKEADLREDVTPEEATTHLMYHLGAVMSISHQYKKEHTTEQLRRTVDLLLNGLVE